MRNAIIVLILLFVAITGASNAASSVDLDKPGALDALARDRPAHHRMVMEEIAKAQTIHLEPEGIEYRVTALMTKSPARLEKAK